MLTTDVRRANAVPKPLLLACLVFLALRVILIGWSCFVAPAKISDIGWVTDPQSMHFDSTIANNLSGKLKLLYVYNTDGLPVYRFVDSTVLNNRAVVQAMKENFDTYRLESGDHVDPNMAKLIAKYRVGSTPTFVVTLPDGTIVSSIGIVSDRSMIDFFAYCKSYRYWTAAGPYIIAGDDQAAVVALENWSKMSRDATSRCNALIYEWMVKRRLGQNAEADACLAQVLKTPGERYSKHIAKYLLGSENQATMLKETGEGFANFAIAEKNLFEGNKDKAKTNFEKAISQGSSEHVFYRLSIAELKALGVNYADSESDDVENSDTQDEVNEVGSSD